MNVLANEIEQQLKADIDACNTLLKLLDQEQLALKDRDADRLAEVVEKKIAPLSRLEESAKQRAQWANITEPERASEQWKAFLATLNHQQVKDDWSTLKALTHECQQKNEVNGKVLVRHQQVYGRLLDLMRGQTASPNLYDAAGSATNRQNSHKFGEA